MRSDARRHALETADVGIGWWHTVGSGRVHDADGLARDADRNTGRRTRARRTILEVGAGVERAATRKDEVVAPGRRRAIQRRDHTAAAAALRDRRRPW